MTLTHGNQKKEGFRVWGCPTPEISCFFLFGVTASRLYLSEALTLSAHLVPYSNDSCTFTSTEPVHCVTEKSVHAPTLAQRL